MAKNPVFDRNLYLLPIFEGDIVYFETALPFEGEEISLLYPIDEIISVRNYRLDIEYKGRTLQLSHDWFSGGLCPHDGIRYLFRLI